MQFKINFSPENNNSERAPKEPKDEAKLFGLDKDLLDELYDNSSKTDGENNTPYGHY